MCPLTIGSLFAGIGGLELGLERAGLGPVKWQVEIDPFCREVLAMHWPTARKYEDVAHVGELEYVDVVCGGFPCQDISHAGKRAGIEGAKSGLWREYGRIVRLVRPRYIIVENVSALLGRGMGVVLRDLAESGYDACWDCIPAQAVGAPHRRDRLFIVAWRVSDASGEHGLRELQPGTSGLSPEPVSMGGEEMAGPDSESPSGLGGLFDGRRSPFGHHVNRCRSEVVADPDGERTQGGERYARSERGDASGIGSTEFARRGTGRSAGVASGAFPPGPGDMQAWGRVPVDTQPALCRVDDGVPRRAHRLRSLGNAVVPLVAEVSGRLVVEMERCRLRESG